MMAAGLFVLVSSVLVFSCSKSSSGYGSNPGGTYNPPPANTVSIKNIAFSPTTLTVAVGTTVTWTNNDNMTHTVTANDNSFDSGNLAYGATFSYKFNAAGTFNYHCSYHASMLAKIIVQ